MKTSVTHRKGVLLIWITLLGMVFIGFVGFACDFALAYFVNQRLQIGADATALAGALKVGFSGMDNSFTQARQLAFNIGLLNTASQAPMTLSLNTSNSSGGDIVIGHFNRNTNTFTPTFVGADAVQTRTHRPDGATGPVALLFGPIFGVNSVTLTRTATAMNVGGMGAGIIALNQTAPGSFLTNGNPIINMPNGAIQVDSNNNTGLDSVGGPTYNVPDINVVGSQSYISSNTAFNGNLNNNAPYVPDPLAYLANLTPAIGPPLPSPNVKNNETVTIDPGYYPNGISFNNGTLIMNPGVYILDGTGLDVAGNASLIALGVMIYVGPGGKKCSIDLLGTSLVQITPMTTGTYAGVSLWQDARNPNTVTISGTNSTHVGGILYFPGAEADINGTGDGFGNQLIADKVSVSGNGTININYNGNPTITGTVFLVQ